MLTELFTGELAKVVYNKALDDVFKWHAQKQENMEADFYSLYKDIRR